MSGHPQSQPSTKKGTESYPSVSDDESYGLETTLAGAPTENDSVGQGLPKISLVQQGKQKIPQKGEASATEPSAGTSDSRNTPSREQLWKLYERAIKTPKNTKGVIWPDEHVDFFEAYIALHTDSDTKAVRYEALEDDYKGFLKPHPLPACYNKVSDMRRGRLTRSNRWKSLCLDGT